jgi:hypothetical protein
MVDKRPITNAHIENFISKSDVKYFQGVFSADNINNRITTMSRFIIVCNLSKEDEEGSHFVTIVFYDGTLLYLDSLGLNVTKYNHINTFLKKLRILIFFTLTAPIQNMTSNACGYYCIFFILYFNRLLKDDADTDAIPKMEKFSKTNLEQNDNICMTNIDKLR